MNTNNDNKRFMIGGKFDSVAFNREFKVQLSKQEYDAQMIENDKINKINDYYIKKTKLIEMQNKNKKKDILFEWHNCIKEIFTDLMLFISFNYDDTLISIFIKNNRLFYIGLTTVTIGIIGYFIGQFTNKNTNTNANTNTNFSKQTIYISTSSPTGSSSGSDSSTSVSTPINIINSETLLRMMNARKNANIKSKN